MTRFSVLILALLTALVATAALADEAQIAQAIETAAESLRGDEFQFTTDVDVLGIPATVTEEGFAFCIPPDPWADPVPDPVPPLNVYGCQNDVTVQLATDAGVTTVTMSTENLFVDCSTQVISSGTGYVTCSTDIVFQILVEEVGDCTVLTLVPGSVDFTAADLDGEFTDGLITMYWSIVAPLFLEQFNNQDAQFEILVEALLVAANEQLCQVVAVDDQGALPGPAVGLLRSVVPNPFNPRTVIHFALDREGAVSLEVYDLRGRRVATLVDAWLPVGDHEAVFAADGLASGVYFARLATPGAEDTTKLVLAR